VKAANPLGTGLSAMPLCQVLRKPQLQVLTLFWPLPG
jgi:hypothetical protein